MKRQMTNWKMRCKRVHWQMDKKWWPNVYRKWRSPAIYYPRKGTTLGSNGVCAKGDQKEIVFHTHWISGVEEFRSYTMIMDRGCLLGWEEIYVHFSGNDSDAAICVDLPRFLFAHRLGSLPVLANAVPVWGSLHCAWATCEHLDRPTAVPTHIWTVDGEAVACMEREVSPVGMIWPDGPFPWPRSE